MVGDDRPALVVEQVVNEIIEWKVYKLLAHFTYSDTGSGEKSHRTQCVKRKT